MDKKNIYSVINALVREISDFTNMLQAAASEQREEQISRVIENRKEKVEELMLLLKEE